MEFIKVFLLLSTTITTTYIITDAAPQFSFDNVLSPPRLNLCEVYIRHHGYWNCNSVCAMPTTNATTNSTMNVMMNGTMNLATTTNPATTTSATTSAPMGATTSAATTTTAAPTTTMAAAAVMAG